MVVESAGFVCSARIHRPVCRLNSETRRHDSLPGGSIVVQFIQIQSITAPIQTLLRSSTRCRLTPGFKRTELISTPFYPTSNQTFKSARSKFLDSRHLNTPESFNQDSSIISREIHEKCGERPRPAMLKKVRKHSCIRNKS